MIRILINQNIYKQLLLEYYFVFLLFLLPISALLKLYTVNIFFFKNFLSSFIYLKIFFILYTILLFFFLEKKKFNSKILLLLILNFIFLCNVIFNNKIVFIENQSKYFYFLEYIDINTINITHLKSKIIINNLLLIMLPLLLFSFINLKLYKFDIGNILFKFSSSFIFFLIFYFFLLKIFYESDKSMEMTSENNLISPHSIYLGIMYFIISLLNLIIFKKKKNLVLLFLLLITFIILYYLKAILILLISFICLAIALAIKKKIKGFLLIIVLSPIIYIIFMLIINYKFSNYFYLGDHSILHNLNTKGGGKILYSLAIRVGLINFYFFEIDKLNVLIGSSIFTDNNFTYPHNILVDIFISTGFIGAIIFSIIILRLFNSLKKLINFPKFYLFILVFSAIYIHSIFSGFFFDNFQLNIILCIFLILEKFNDKKNSYKSL
jgi:hypothetical protein